MRVIGWLDTADEDRVFMSVISLAEIRRGIRLMPDGRRREALERWLLLDLPERFGARLLDIDRRVATAWGDLMAESKLKGAGLEPMDAFLAATAFAHQLTLVTRNTRHFAGLPVSLLNPWGDE
jgi:toxin FitB